MKELITRSQADALIWAIAAMGAIAGPLAALIARRKGQNPVKFGLLVGGPLVLCALLWPIYNAIEDHFGLDSIAALAINGGIFVGLGLVVGLSWKRVFPGSEDTEANPENA